MTSIETLLARYRSTLADDKVRLDMVSGLIARARTERSALDTLLYVLNEDGSSEVRLAIVKFLEIERPMSAVAALTKEMFDPDPIIRAHAAVGLAGYNDARMLARSLSALFDALPDPATRAPADRAIRAVTGRSPDQITVSERHRVKLGEHPETIWVEYYESLRRHSSEGGANDSHTEN